MVPLYQYRCDCGNEFEVNHPLADGPATCECGKTAKKVYGLAGLAVKGSGFYSTAKPVAK